MEIHKKSIRFELKWKIISEAGSCSWFWYKDVLEICKYVYKTVLWTSYHYLLYPPYPKDQGMLWFYVEAARRPPPTARPPPAMVLTR